MKVIHLFIYFASAAVAVDSSHMTLSSSTLWSRFSPPSNFVNGHVLPICSPSTDIAFMCSLSAVAEFLFKRLFNSVRVSL